MSPIAAACTIANKMKKKTKKLDTMNVNDFTNPVY